MTATRVKGDVERLMPCQGFFTKVTRNLDMPSIRGRISARYKLEVLQEAGNPRGEGSDVHGRGNRAGNGDSAFDKMRSRYNLRTAGTTVPH